MGTCFVIQPFDNGKFDKRFNDTFEPAIKAAGYDAYRIDRDLSADILIEKIEETIRESDICFAEISTNNPNVWYELGYALACGKNVVIVCSNEREGPFPFDIRHRHIIIYSTESQSDFEKAANSITSKIKAIKINLESRAKNKEVTESVSIEGIKSHELALLLTLMEEQLDPDEKISLYVIKNNMNYMGYRDLATSMGIRSLLDKGLINKQEVLDNEHDQYYTALSLTPRGEEIILHNQDYFNLKRDQPLQKEQPTDTIPF